MAKKPTTLGRNQTVVAPADIIHSYTRAQAIEDGVLVDVSRLAGEAGFSVPVAITGTAYGHYVAVPDGVTGQDVTGRLWDVLYMLHVAIKRKRGGSTELFFELYVRNSDASPPKLVKLKAISGPGDNGEHVITIMLPDED